MTSSPTPAQVAQVQLNLSRMQKFNDFVYNEGGQSRLMNAYLLLSDPDSSDLGLNIGLNILEGAFWAIGGMFGPVGNFAASFLSGMLSYWAESENTPPDLNQTFASMEIRTQHTSLAVDAALANLYQDVAGNWNTSFSFNGKTCALSDLATFTFPAETDPDFETMAAAAIFAFDQQVWTTVMRTNYVITLWEMSSGDDIMPGQQNQPPVSWDESFIKANPSYYNTWTWHESSGCGDTTGWDVSEYNIGTGAGVFSDGHMSNAACGYLFIDSADGVVINANGLFARKTVFTGLGLPQKTYIVPNTPPVGQSLSVGYLRAMKAGRTLRQLVERVGRPAVEAMIIEKAHADPVFARNLEARTRETLEDFLGVKIPEVLGLSVIVERPGTFGLVIPQKK